ncbi:hypothetical protein IAT38_007156 [Cryptococcus sp. DSM 104549]
MLRACRSCRGATTPLKRSISGSASPLPQVPIAPPRRVSKAFGDEAFALSPFASRLGNSIPEILHGLTKIKAEGAKPNAAAYITIIQAAADFAGTGNPEIAEERHGLGWQIAMGAFRDAELGGIDLGSEGIEVLMRFGITYPHLVPSFLKYLHNYRSPQYYRVMGAIAAQNYEYEQHMLVIDEMLHHDFMPDVFALEHMCRSACEWGSPRLALQLVQKVEMEGKKGLQANHATWVDILISSVDSHYMHGMETAWTRVKDSYTPDDGLIVSMLNTAGRWGRPDFATRIVADHLGGKPLQEQHLAPMLEAFCNAGDVPSALRVIPAIRAAGLEPSMETLQPIISVLTSAEVIDEAFYSVEDMHKAGEPVDLAALHVLIAASAEIGDLQRVRATQTAVPDFGLTPTAETFNLVLAGCVKAKHRPLGDTLLTEMESANPPIAPNAETYEQIIELCATQPVYEDAFYFLEKMKADGFTPSIWTYTTLVKKCVVENDSRFNIVADEMRLVGYKMEESLRAFINSGGKIDPQGEHGRRGGSRPPWNDKGQGDERRPGGDRRGDWGSHKGQDRREGGGGDWLGGLGARGGHAGGNGGGGWGGNSGRGGGRGAGIVGEQ